MAEKSQPQRKSSLSIHDTCIAGLYDLQKTIGKGHFAVVKMANHVFTGEQVAVKVIDKTKFDPSMASHLMKEVRCMKLVQHPNIVRLYEVIDTQTKLFLILELGDYDMYDFIMRNADKGCPEGEARQYFCQIIKAIDYCHQLHVVHRDLKPENVVFFERLGMVKLTDFGFSNKFTPGEQLETACGSLAYSAPEILLGDAYDAPAVDVWSLGVILYMLLCGRLPFQEANDSETLTKILDCKYSLPDTLSSHAHHLISRMLVKDVKKRATLKEISENPWVRAGDLGLAQILPLVGRDVLPESAHATIIEQMVAGGVDTEERILRSLENDDFSYVTATYYLLAERVLASYREERAREAHAARPVALGDLPADSENCPENRDSAPGKEEGSSYRSRSRSNSWRGSTAASRRPCSILKEESEEELSTYYRNTSRQSSRHSSPSVSAFASSAGSRGRVSPQDIQDLLELSRLSVTEGRRRAPSPDSRLSSRSSSPPSSSGRTSPAVGRLRTSFPGASGLRKLSSSPHLLGICEETEEFEFDKGAEQRQTATRRSISGASVTAPPKTRLFTQSKFVKEDLLNAPLTYSKVRMIRPRQAIVSPDMAQRYEQRPSARFPTTRPRRSTSCSSSETSDDDSERRLNFLASKYCHHNGNERDNDDDPSKGSGGTSKRHSDSGSGPVAENKTNASGDTRCPHGCQSSEHSSTSRYNNSLSLKSSDSFQVVPTPLHPIEEMPTTFLSRSLLPRSKTAEMVVAEWVDISFLDLAQAVKQRHTQRCTGTPSRHSRVVLEECDYYSFGCVRTLRQSSSFPDLSCLSSVNREQFFDWEDDSLVEEEADSLLWTSTDSGCSSDGDTDSPPRNNPEKHAKQLVRRKHFLAKIEECSHFVATQ